MWWWEVLKYRSKALLFFRRFLLLISSGGCEPFISTNKPVPIREWWRFLTVIWQYCSAARDCWPSLALTVNNGWVVEFIWFYRGYLEEWLSSNPWEGYEEPSHICSPMHLTWYVPANLFLQLWLNGWVQTLEQGTRILVGGPCPIGPFDLCHGFLEEWLSSDPLKGCENPCGGQYHWMLRTDFNVVWEFWP